MAFEDWKVTMCWPNRVDTSTLSGTGWSTTLPLDNTKNSVFGKKARTTTDTGIQINAVLSTNRQIGSIALAAHNITTAGSWRVRLYENAADVGTNNFLWDSGTMPAWEAVYDSLDLEWEDDNFWFGTISEEERENFNPFSVVFADDNYLIRAITIDLEDEGNPDGYIQIGRLFFAPVYQPTINMSFGVQMGLSVDSDQETAWDGTDYIYSKRFKRTVRYELHNMQQDEAFSTIFNMKRQLGKDGEILFAYNLQTNAQKFIRTFIARMEDIDPISHPYIERFDTAIQLKEKI